MGIAADYFFSGILFLQFFLQNSSSVIFLLTSFVFLLLSFPYPTPPPLLMNYSMEGRERIREDSSIDRNPGLFP
jgi:hypothetical protein